LVCARFPRVVENEVMFFLAGPTSVGKTDIAWQVAEQIEAEIIGADALQVYAGLEILTAKPPPDVLARIPHHLIGEIPLTRAFDVAQYIELARARTDKLEARERRILVVGGTGLYMRALTRGLADLPRADRQTRTELEELPLDELRTRLERLDPVGAKRIDVKNPRRLIRALEVCVLTGKPFSSFQEEWQQPPKQVGILLTRSRDDLYRRINGRTERMFAEGVIDEVRSLCDIGPTAAQTIGLREIQMLLRGEISKAECISQIQQATRRYAKRQLTWFKREPMLEEINLTNFPDSQRVAEVISQKFLSAIQDD
jgi:tRNA dimethylallyltransferase